MFTALNGDSEVKAFSVSKVMQWLSGQAHRHLLLSERQSRFYLTIHAGNLCQTTESATLLSVHAPRQSHFPLHI